MCVCACVCICRDSPLAEVRPRRNNLCELLQLPIPKLLVSSNVILVAIVIAPPPPAGEAWRQQVCSKERQHGQLQGPGGPGRLLRTTPYYKFNLIFICFSLNEQTFYTVPRTRQLLLHCIFCGGGRGRSE